MKKSSQNVTVVSREELLKIITTHNQESEPNQKEPQMSAPDKYISFKFKLPEDEKEFLATNECLQVTSNRSTKLLFELYDSRRGPRIMITSTKPYSLLSSYTSCDKNDVFQHNFKFVHLSTSDFAHVYYAEFKPFMGYAAYEFQGRLLDVPDFRAYLLSKQLPATTTPLVVESPPYATKVSKEEDAKTVIKKESVDPEEVQKMKTDIKNLRLAVDMITNNVNVMNSHIDRLSRLVEEKLKTGNCY